MSGPHDLGGTTGHGPIEHEHGEPVFHAEWERRCFALTLAMGATGTWNLDMSRRAREDQPANIYLASSYYRIWLHGLTVLLLNAGLATRDEIATGKAAGSPKPVNRTLKADNVASALATGAPVERPLDTAPAFSPGDKVLVQHPDTDGHTRAPAYIHNRSGVIERVHGGHIFPDAHARGRGEAPQYCYSVRFSAHDLWGRDAEQYQFVYVDLWESYLERQS